MRRRWVKAQRRRVAVVAAGMAGVLVATLGGQLPVLPAAAAEVDPPTPYEVSSVPGHDLAAVKAVPRRDTAPAIHRAPAVAWPAPATAEVDLPAPGGTAGAAVAGVPMVRAGGTPVWIGRAGAAAGGSSAQSAGGPVSRARLQVLDRQAAAGTGRDGVLMRVGRADKGTAAGRVAVRVDFQAFGPAFGGDYAGRLRLVALPDCALNTPESSACKGTVLNTRLDRVAGTIDADLPLAAGTDAAPARGPADGGPAAMPNGQLLMATAASGSSDGGDYTATSLSPSATWSAGGSAGEFGWSYPLRVPPSLGGPAPKIALSYSSQSVDGRTSASNNQPSWIGEGFDYTPGYIERSYKACADDGQSNVGDLCWGGDNATMALAGHGGELIQDGGNASLWHPKNDDGTKVEKLTGAVNTGDRDGEYWKVTTTDGTQYFFGLNHLPGWTTGKPETRATWTVPVFGNNSNEPCNNPAGFAASVCDRAYRWNLDYVVDPHGNTMSAWYTQETNNYARNATDSTVSSYVRGGSLTRIDYGTRQAGGVDTEYSQPAVPMRVDFATEDRCITAGGTCTPSNRSNWPDVVWDQNCTSATSCPGKYSPTFWTTKMLSSVTTRVWTGSGNSYRDVERWTLSHEFKDPGDLHPKILWLKSISHHGLGGADTPLPDLTFAAVPLNNRVDVNSSTDPIIRYRLAGIYNELGGVTSVTYSRPDCTLGSRMPSSPDNNSMRCFPAYWYPPLATDLKLGWFHKYVVTDVSVSDASTAGDPTLASPTVAYTYSYINPGGKALWHHDDAEMVPPSRRSWGQWRGYEKVRTTTGQAGTTQSQTDILFFRGMDGDKTTSGNRSVAVTDSTGVSLPDASWRAGQVRETIRYNGTGDAAPYLSKTLSDPWEHGPTATRDRNGVVVNAYITGTRSVHTRLAMDGGRGDRTTTTTNTFDYDDGTSNPIGRVTMVDDAGDDATPDDDRCTRTSYATNPGRWMLTHVAEVETVAVACAITPNRMFDTLSDVRTWYDGAALFDKQVGKGDVTRTERLSAWFRSAPIHTQMTRASYDDYGRPVDSYDPLDRKTHTDYTPAADAPVTSTSVKNPLNWTTTTMIDTAWGIPTAIVDANNRRTDLTYDGLGRLTAVWLPGRSKANQTANKTFGYQASNSGTPSYITSAVLNTTGTGYHTTYSTFDGLARPRQVQTAGANNLGRIIIDTRYDSRGLQSRTTRPFFNNNAAAGTLFVYNDADIPGYTITAYDNAERPTAARFMSRNAEQWRTTTAYGGDHVDITPPLGGTATTTISDARGRTTQLRQYQAATPTGGYDTTTYRYDHADRLAAVTDPANNTWTYTYDPAGRKTGTTDPDRGPTTYTYDNADQLATVTDARNTTLAYTYDPVGRKKAMHEGSTSGPTRAEWTYDTLLAGKPTSATRYDNDQHPYTTAVTGYDDAYRPTGTAVTLPAGEGPLAGTYTTTSTYNADGSPATTTLPAAGGLPAETLTYGYNPTGLPTTLTGLTSYITETHYDNLGDTTIQYLSTGNGHTTSQYWFYDEPTNRLNRHAVYNDTAPHYLTDTFYTYTPAGTITSIADRLAGYNEGATNDTQCFTQDYLQRLTQAWTPANGNCQTTPTTAGLGGPAPYWQTWTYDTIGNRRTQTDHTPSGDTTHTYTPDPTRPHTLKTATHTKPGTTTIATTDSYDYDATGNTTTRPATGQPQTLTWDIEGKLATVTDNGQTTSFLYDADGNRLIRRDPNTTTVYLGGTELRLAKGTNNITCTRYYGNAVRTPTGLNWLAADHQDTDNITVEAATGKAITRRQTPFGTPRGPQPPTWPGEKGFVGGDQDPTGLTHLGARDYDPTIGRFVSVDPVQDMGNPQQWHGYTYANNNPITGSDPTGLRATDIDDTGQTTDKGVDHPQRSNGPQCGGSENSDGCGGGGGGVSDNRGEGNGHNHHDWRRRGEKSYIPPVIKFTQCDARASAVLGCQTGAQIVVPPVCQDVGGGSERIVDCIKNPASTQGDPWGVLMGVTIVASIAIDVAALFLTDGAAEPYLMGAEGAVVRAEGELERDYQETQAAEAAAARAGRRMQACNSFDGDTPVLLADGHNKPIDEIRIGDQVQATNPETGTTSPRPVAALHLNHDAYLADVTIVGPNDIYATLHTTPRHLFWNQTRHTWTEAAKLKPGDQLHTIHGTATVTTVRSYIGHKPMYNLTIQGTHTYYVLAGNTAVLVHNDNGFDWEEAEEELARSWDPGSEDDDGYHAPRGNQAENREFRGAMQEIERSIGRKLSPAERRALHDRVSGQGYGYHRIVSEGKGMFRGC